MATLEVLSQDFHTLQREWSERTTEVQKAASESHTNIIRDLGTALDSLSKVVNNVHADYKDRASLSDEKLELLRRVKEAFDAVDQKASSDLRTFGEHQEQVNAAL